MRVTCVDWMLLGEITAALTALLVIAVGAIVDARARRRDIALRALIEEQTPAGVERMAAGLEVAARSLDRAHQAVDRMADHLAVDGRRKPRD